MRWAHAARERSNGSMVTAGRTGADSLVSSPPGDSPALVTKYQPTIVELSQAPAGPWPTVGDIALGVAVLTAHVALSNDFYGAKAAVCAGFLAAIFVVLATRYVKRRPGRLPWLEIIFGVYYAQFGLPLLGEPCPAKVQGQIPPPEAQDSAAILSLFAGLALVAGFVAARWAA